MEELTFAGAVIVAGGLGKRMGRPKQMLPLAGLPVLVRAVQAFQQVRSVRQIVVVTSPENREILKKHFTDLTYALPGATRLLSVMNGVQALDPKVQAVAVHDGARPLVDPAAAGVLQMAEFIQSPAQNLRPVTLRRLRGP